MALVLEIEHLLGVAFAAQGPDRAEPDWPPQPDRVFSALVAAWAARGEVPAERAALEWLEHQDAPTIAAAAYSQRPALLSFVPPNDPASGSKGKLTVMPARRARQPRRFPAALPEDSTVRLMWHTAEVQHLATLDAIARDVGYVGHSASLTRCRFLTDATSAASQPARRRIYPGRLRDLEVRFRAGQRPLPGQDVVPAQISKQTPPDWLVLQLIDNRAESERRVQPTALTIDLRAAPVACKALRDAVMSGYGKAGLPVPEWVSGHQPDGAPTKAAHLAAVPLAFAGYPNADGNLLGLALIPPAGHDLLDDDGFVAAMRTLVSPEADAIRLTLGRLGELLLAPTFDSAKRSLQPGRYCCTALRWTTLTPLVLDRHLKEGDGPEAMAAIVATSAARTTGTPVAQVVLSKHAAIEGAPSAAPSGRAPRWTGWTVPDKLRSRRLVHATIVFKRAVTGPVLLGAGRFYGLGLCLPLPDTAS